jgi:hypothetical protein
MATWLAQYRARLQLAIDVGAEIFGAPNERPSRALSGNTFGARERCQPYLCLFVFFVAISGPLSTSPLLATVRFVRPIVAQANLDAAVSRREELVNSIGIPLEDRHVVVADHQHLKSKRPAGIVDHSVNTFRLAFWYKSLIESTDLRFATRQDSRLAQHYERFPQCGNDR